jgi:hypothetical protein
MDNPRETVPTVYEFSEAKHMEQERMQDCKKNKIYQFIGQSKSKSTKEEMKY